MYTYKSKFIYMYTYNRCNIWGVQLVETHCLPASFIEGRRIYKFISICELCIQLGNLTSYK